MNQINRLENAWTPEWDLGLQEEFGFLSQAPAQEVEEVEHGGRWALATKEVFNRQNTLNRRVACDTSSVGDLISYFESLYKPEEGAENE